MPDMTAPATPAAKAAAERLGRPLWIDGATEAELDEVQAMDEEIARLEAEIASLRWKRMRLTNRCCQRAKYRNPKP